MILAVGSLPILLLELERDTLIHHDQAFLYFLNLLVVVAFGVDYIVEISLDFEQEACPLRQSANGQLFPHRPHAGPRGYRRP